LRPAALSGILVGVSEEDAEQLNCMRIVRMLLPWREQLDTAFGTSHGNADLKTIDVLIVMLAAFFNPIARSHRCIEALSRQEHLREQTGIARVPKSTLFDALRRFDPEQLHPLIGQLAARIPALGRRNADLEKITRQIVAADGSYFALLGEAAWAMNSGRLRDDGTPRQDQFRFNLQLDVQSFSPVDCDISGGDDNTEAKAFIRRLKPGVIYVADRNFVHYGFVNAVFAKDSNLVLRIKKSNTFRVESSRVMDDSDHAASVIADELGHLPGAQSEGNEDHRSFSDKPPTRLLRRVTVWDEKNQKPIILLTDLLDVPASVIGTIYRQRWQIELFFKWLKCWAGLDQMISRDPKAITLQFYVAVIATLLLHLTTGRRPSKYSLMYLGWVSQGLIDWAGMEAGMAVVEREKELAQLRLKRKRLEKALAKISQ
jgi:hypothetical protein